jgi:pyruvate/2-oxoglutarate dehydrogenase complex dihydrolipoamide acyltransferase (E2) component
MAVAIDDGFIVPVIRECQSLTLAKAARAARRLVAKAASVGLSVDELSGATFFYLEYGAAWD